MEGANNVQKKINQRNWDSPLTRGENSWTMFKVMSEFVEGFETLNKIGPCVSIFGSARTKPEDKYYKLSEEVAFQLTQNGYGVITGGGPGIMEAGSESHRPPARHFPRSSCARQWGSAPARGRLL